MRLLAGSFRDAVRDGDDLEAGAWPWPRPWPGSASATPGSTSPRQRLPDRRAGQGLPARRLPGGRADRAPRHAADRARGVPVHLRGPPGAAPARGELLALGLDRPGDDAEYLPAALTLIMRDVGIPNGIGGVGYDEGDVDLVEGTMKQQRARHGTAPGDRGRRGRHPVPLAVELVGGVRCRSTSWPARAGTAGDLRSTAPLPACPACGGAIPTVRRARPPCPAPTMLRTCTHRGDRDYDPSAPDGRRPPRPGGRNPELATERRPVLPTRAGSRLGCVPASAARPTGAGGARRGRRPDHRAGRGPAAGRVADLDVRAAAGRVLDRRLAVPGAARAGGLPARPRRGRGRRRHLPRARRRADGQGRRHLDRRQRRRARRGHGPGPASRRVLALDPEAATATVEPGVVLDHPAAARPHGLRFGPDPSTHSRCTLGGMIGNNACGSRALAYGRTADNVLELEVVCGTGQRLRAGPGTAAAVPLEEVVRANLAPIRTQFGRFARQNSATSWSTCSRSGAATWPGPWPAARAPWPWSFRPPSGWCGPRPRPCWSCSATRTWPRRPTRSARSCAAGRWPSRASTPASSRWSGAGAGPCRSCPRGRLAAGRAGRRDRGRGRGGRRPAGRHGRRRRDGQPGPDRPGRGGRHLAHPRGRGRVRRAQPGRAPAWAGWEDAAVPPTGSAPTCATSRPCWPPTGWAASPTATSATAASTSASTCSTGPTGGRSTGRSSSRRPSWSPPTAARCRASTATGAPLRACPGCTSRPRSRPWPPSRPSWTRATCSTRGCWCARAPSTPTCAAPRPARSPGGSGFATARTAAT